MRYLLSLLVLLMLSSVAVADERLSWGPFISRSTGVIKVHQLRPNPIRVDVLESGEMEVVMSFAYGNIWHPGRNVFLDYEFSRTSLAVYMGGGEGTEIGVEIGGYTHFGGFLDGSLEASHKLLGFPQDGRNWYPRNESIMRWPTRVFGGPGNQIQDISIYHKQRFTPEGSDIVVAGGLTGKLNIAPALYGTGEHDVGLWLGGRLPIVDDFQLFGSSTLTFMGKGGKEFFGVQLARMQWSIFGAMGIRLSDTLTLFSQSLITSPVSTGTNVGLLSENTYEVTTGLRVAFSNISGPGFMEMGITEDAFILGNAADITFVVNMVLRY